MIGTPERNTTSAASGSATMLNSAEAVVFPSPIEPPIRHRCEIFGARCGYSRRTSAMLVSGPIGAIATGSGLSSRMRAMSATAPSGRAVVGAGSSLVSPIPLSPWTSVARTTDPSRAPAAPSATGTSSRPYAWSSRRAFSVQRVTSALPPTVVTASSRISGLAAARPIASASSRPGSESMISGSGCSRVPTGAVRSPAGALW